MDQHPQHIANICSLIEETLDKLVPLTSSLYNEIFSAARYSLLGGGKRLRPLLAILTAEMLGTPMKEAVTSACALEMIHTYSLIHDDLPCMDNDDFRRGKPSLHKAFNEAGALLAGDYLLTFAFDTLAHDPQIPAATKLKLISTLAKNSGGHGMIAGQMMDISLENKSIDLKTLQEIHLKKTGMLIAASLEFGAIIAKATKPQEELLREFGLKIGLAFQIADDILDVTSSKEKHGRDTPSDLLNDKTTYVSLMGIEGSKKLVESLTMEALDSLKTLPFDTHSLEFLTKSLITRKI